MADNETPVTDPSSIYGVNDRGEAVLRVAENGTGDASSIYCVNDEGKACMRVSENVTSNDPTSIYGINEEGKPSVRVIGASGSGAAHYIEKTVDVDGALGNGTNIIDFTGVKIIKSDVLAYAYRKNTDISGALDMSDVEVVQPDSCIYAFNSATRITSVDLSRLVVSQNTGCQNMFNNATSLSTALLSSFKTVGNCQNMFAKTALTTLSFPALQSISTTANISTIINNVTDCTIHFPKNFDPQSGSTVISDLTGYPNFGGTNTVLAFDLPATNLLIGVNTTVYERNPKYDTETALAWRVQDEGTPTYPVVNWTPFYTSGMTDPVVGATIYSDSTCTTEVTTISSIV